MTAPGDVVPSPQSHTAVCVSITPGSENVAFAVTSARLVTVLFTVCVTSLTGSAGAVIGPAEGAKFATSMVAVSSAAPPLLSVTRTDAGNDLSPSFTPTPTNSAQVS